MKKFKNIFIVLVLFSIAVILHSFNVYADDKSDKPLSGDINKTYVLSIPQTASQINSDSDKTEHEIVLQAGKSYEFDNPLDNEIRIKNSSNWNTIKYDYVSTDSIGKTEWDRNEYGDIKIPSGGKILVTVKDNDITCWISGDVYGSISYRESSTKALEEFTLHAGKSYEFDNPLDNEIRIKNSSNWNTIKYDYVSTDSIGKTEWDRNEYGDIKIPSGGKILVTVKDNDITCWIPGDVYSSISYRESSTKALEKFTLQAGKGYEFENHGADEVSIKNNSDWNTIKYDYVSTDSIGKTEWDRNEYGDIKIPSGGKILVTVKDNDITCWIPEDVYSSISYRESSIKALEKFTLHAGKSYEFDNPLDNEIRIKNSSNWNTIKYDYVSTDSIGKTEWDRNEYGDIKIPSGGKILVTVKDNDITCWIPGDVYSSISYRESSTKALEEFTLQAGKGYEFKNPGDSKVSIKNNSDWNTTRYDYLSIDSKGNITYTPDSTSNYIEIQPHGRVIAVVKDKDIICWYPENGFESDIQYSALNVPSPVLGEVTILKNEVIKSSYNGTISIAYIGNGSNDKKQFDVIGEMKDNNKTVEVKGASCTVNAMSTSIAVLKFNSCNPTDDIDVYLPQTDNAAEVVSYGTRQEYGQVITTGVAVNNTDKDKDLGISSIAYDEQGKIIEGKGEYEQVQTNGLKNLSVTLYTAGSKVSNVDTYTIDNVVNENDIDDDKCEYANQLLGSYYSGANSDYDALYGNYNIQDTGIMQENIDIQRVLNDKDRNSCVTLPTGSYVTVGFQKPVSDILYIKENGAAGDYALVLASSDDKNYSKIGIAQTGAVTAFDLKKQGFNGSVSSVTVIGLDNEGYWPGFDLVYVKGEGLLDEALTHHISGEDARNSIEKDYNKYKDSQSMSRDPVDTSTGAHVIDRTLLKENGTQTLDFTVKYNSLLLNRGVMGTGWEHNYDTKLEIMPNGNILVHWTGNYVNEFVLKHGNVYECQDLSMKNYSITKNYDGKYILVDKDKNVYEFNESGQLMVKKNRNNQSVSYDYDSPGKLVKVTENISGMYFKFQYNQEGNVQQVSDSLGRKVSFEYDGNSNLISIMDADGNVINYTYNNKGQVLTSTYGNGVQIFKDVYDDKGRVSSQDDSLNSNKLTTFDYDEISEQGHILTTVTNRNGNKKVLTHDNNYNLLKVQDELGSIKTYTYDNSGNRISETDENGNITRYAYDDRGNLISITDALGSTTKMAYDSNNSLLSVEDSSGKKTINTYSSSNNLLTAADVLGNVVTNTYDGNDQLLSTKNKNGALTKYSYKNGLLAVETDSLGNNTTYAYDAAGRKLKIIDASGKATSFEYDNNDNVTSVTDSLNNKVTAVYNIFGNKLETTDARGNTTKYNYDGNGNLIAEIDPLGNKITYEYDGEGKLIKTTDYNGSSTEYAYDAAGRKTSVTDGLGNTVRMNYDPAGNLTGNIDALGNKVLDINYDKLSRIKSTVDAENNSVVNKYDSLGRLVEITDAMGNSSKFEYDDLSRMISAQDNLNGVSNQNFDAENNLLSLVDSNENKVTYTYDSEGRVISETSDAGKTIKYFYNSRGLISKIINARGQSTTYSYDAAGKLVGFEDNLGNIQYTYDANGNVTSIKDASGTISKKYDVLNRLVKYVDVNGNSISYEYDANGNIATVTYPDRKKVKYAYDGTNKLKTVTDWNNNVTSYEYDADGNIVKEIKPDNSVYIYNYDKLSQIAEIKDIDRNGNIINKYNYSYDKNGNTKTERSYIKDTAVQIDNVSMTYGKDNRIASYNGKNVIFDADGNMTSGPLDGKIADYKYDCRNRLISVGNTQYVYDALNNRIAVVENGTKTSYVINPNAKLGQLLVEKADDGKETYYVYGLGLISEETSDGEYRIYHFDKRGSTTALTDKSGNITDRFQYDVYGRLVNHEGNSKTPFLYVGKSGVMRDSNGLYYMRTRYYNADIKRFVNQDVVVGNIEEGQSMNQFAYTRDNPVDFTDPSGFWAGSDDVVAMISGASLGIISEMGEENSTWEDYVGAAIGGAVAGEAALYFEPMLGIVGAAGAGEIEGDIKSIVSQGIKSVSRNEEFSMEEVAEEGLKGFGQGLIGGFAGKILENVPVISKPIKHSDNFFNDFVWTEFGGNNMKRKLSWTEIFKESGIKDLNDFVENFLVDKGKSIFKNSVVALK